MTTPDPTRSKAIEVMADAISGPLWGDPSAEDLAAIALDALQAEGMALVPVAHLEPFAKYYRSRMAIKMRGVDDVIHRIHPGSEHEAEISVTDCGRLAEAIPPASPSMKAGKEESDG